MTRVHLNKFHRVSIDRNLQRLQSPTSTEIKAVIRHKPIHKRIRIARRLHAVRIGWIDIHAGSADVFRNNQIAPIIRMDPLITTLAENSVKCPLHGGPRCAQFHDAAHRTIFLSEEQRLRERIPGRAVEPVEVRFAVRTHWRHQRNPVCRVGNVQIDARDIRHVIAVFMALIEKSMSVEIAGCGALLQTREEQVKVFVRFRLARFDRLHRTIVEIAKTRNDPGRILQRISPLRDWRKHQPRRDHIRVGNSNLPRIRRRHATSENINQGVNCMQIRSAQRNRRQAHRHP